MGENEEKICFIPIDNNHTSLVFNNNGKVTKVTIPVLDKKSVPEIQQLSKKN